MTYHGIVKNGQVFVEGGVPLPDGAKVDFEVRVLENGATRESANGRSDDVPSGAIPDSLVGCIDDLPPDFAARHDHYIHGRSDV